MKHVSHKIQLILVFFFSSLGYFLSCTHDNSFPPAPASTAVVVTHGNNIFLPGNLTTGVPTEWKLDKVHSSTLWSTNYVGAAGLLTGRFNQFGMHDVIPAEMINYPIAGQPLKDTSWAFYENDPTKSYFNGYVHFSVVGHSQPLHAH